MINAYPVTPKMGLRESINAMLQHVAYDHNFGYRAPVFNASNHAALLRDFPQFVRETSVYHTSTLELQPVIADSAGFASFVEILVTLCNEYPVYDEQHDSSLRYDREVEHVLDCLRDPNFPLPDGATADDMWQAITESGNGFIHESDGSVYINESDWFAAYEYLPAMLAAEAERERLSHAAPLF